MLSHVLKLKHLGPVQECVLTVSRFTVLTGPQSNGKSTVAKAMSLSQAPAPADKGQISPVWFLTAGGIFKCFRLANRYFLNLL